MLSDWEKIEQENERASVAAYEKAKAQAEILASVTVDELVAELRRRIEPMKPGSRLDVLDAVADDYCIQCGDRLTKGVCHCMNDE